MFTTRPLQLLPAARSAVRGFASVESPKASLLRPFPSFPSLPHLRWSSTQTSTSDGPLVTLEKANRVATITLNDPKRLNALTVAMGDEFHAIVQDLQRNCDDVGAVVITGAGRAFSAGGDLKYLKQREEDTPSRNAYIMREFYERFLSVRTLPVPVIAAINGPAIGAGACLATACDLRIAAKSSVIGFTFVGLGLHPGMGGTHFLPRVVGISAASRLLLTGSIIPAHEAQTIGLIGDIVDDDELTDAATHLAELISSKSPVAVRSLVRTLRMGQDEGLERSLWREADAQSYSYASSDLAEGVSAVAEKRAPTFTQYDHYREDP